MANGEQKQNQGEVWVGNRKFVDTGRREYLGNDVIRRDRYNKIQEIGGERVERDRRGRAIKVGDKEVIRDRRTDRITQIGDEKIKIYGGEGGLNLD